ncbi:helix-turn-helix domain-containing protein [Streptomyces albipurpureus]|uniref:Helix-turn-helix domain-containing protein n=1 Tax=Streptomyces albipurpureus TaxID=2897419 RepID=A0ABT0URM0_9ACTN|nr:helix-turn-helix transcriptional regulator [Streptomyces sp. CWNU-1]MCM2391203.1 helix-turn-helix domain-containing protein [Streptomyces sp. CWNU-1]
MPESLLGIGPAGVLAARAITRARTARGFAQRQLAERVTALGRPMTITMLSRIECRQRRCDVDDIVAIAAALGLSPLALLAETS